MKQMIQIQNAQYIIATYLSAYVVQYLYAVREQKNALEKNANANCTICFASIGCILLILIFFLE